MRLIKKKTDVEVSLFQNFTANETAFSVLVLKHVGVLAVSFASLVRMEGLEPPRLSAPDPKSGTATNYATCAKKDCKCKR